MKKYVAVILVFVLALTAVACSKGALSQIYEVDNGSLSSDTFNHTNVISDKAGITYDLPVGQAKTLQVYDQTLQLSYKRSIYYTLRSCKVHSYSIDGTDDGSVLFKEDGSLYAILNYPFTTLEIPDEASFETVQAALEPALLDLVDLSKYDSVKAEMYGSGYLVSYLNELHGYYTDYASMLVGTDGTVDALWIRDLTLNAEELCPSIDKTVEEELIIARLKNIYNTGNTEYRSHSIETTPNFCVYENELYVEYNFTCEVYDSEAESEKSDRCHLLIPVELLSGN